MHDQLHGPEFTITIGFNELKRSARKKFEHWMNNRLREMGETDEHLTVHLYTYTPIHIAVEDLIIDIPNYGVHDVQIGYRK